MNPKPITASGVDVEPIDWKQRERNDIALAVSALSQIANRNHSGKVFVELMQREHRTLQQSMTGLMLKWFEHLASLNENYYDLRNQDSVAVAKVIMKALDGRTGLSYI